jgi:hypothetical protein
MPELQGVSLDLTEFAAFGGGELPPFPASPRIRIRAFSLFGGVKLDDRPPRRDLHEAIRARSGNHARLTGTISAFMSASAVSNTPARPTLDCAC